MSRGSGSAKSQSHGKVLLRAANALFARFSAFSVSWSGSAPQHALLAGGNCQGLPRGYMRARKPGLLKVEAIRKLYFSGLPLCLIAYFL